MFEIDNPTNDMEKALIDMKARVGELEKFDDGVKRRSLFLSWLGQADKCIRKGFLQDFYYHSLFWEWMKKAEMLLDGVPVEQCKGKVKVKGQKPMVKKQRLKWKAEHKSEIRAYRNDLQARHMANQKKGKKNNENT